MVNTTEFGESAFLNVDLVKSSPAKTGWILTEGTIEKGKFGNQLVLDIEFDGNKKRWSLNRDTVKNLQFAFGIDSKDWIGQSVKFRTMIINGKEVLIAVPNVTKEEVI